MGKLRLSGTEDRGILTTAATHETHQAMHTMNPGTAHLQQLRYVADTGSWGSEPHDWPAQL